MGADNTTLELMRVADSLGGPSRKLRGTLVAAAPVALAVRPFHGTTRTVGRMLVHLAMLSTASGWKLPSGSEAPEMTITGEAHDSPITGEVDGARDRRRRLVAVWVVVHAELPCAVGGNHQTQYNTDGRSRNGVANTAACQAICAASSACDFFSYSFSANQKCATYYQGTCAEPSTDYVGHGYTTYAKPTSAM